MSEKRRAIFICLLLSFLTLVLYWPAIHFDFINYDDPDYIIYNTSIQHGLNAQSLGWAFRATDASNWHPLTWISHIVDYSFYGNQPGGHHLTNLLLHAANAVLLFLVLWQLTGSQWPSALVAALFAWHPLHVESVAWVSERKDLLCAFFWLLTISAYGRYSQQSNSRRGLWYFLALFLFLLGLLSKPMIVTLPFVLLLLDFWPLKRKISGGLLLEKIPFFVLALIECVVTIRAQMAANSVINEAVLPFSARLANALVSCALYLWKIVWPADLAVAYPYSHFWTFWPSAGAGLLLSTIAIVATLQARQRPYLLVGWLWFLGALTPVIGLVQVGIQPMADRYTYIPLIGVFLMIAWALPEGWARWPRPGLVFGAVVGGVLGLLMAATEVQLQYWRNSVALFTHTVAVAADNILAEYNLAEAMARQGDEAQAIAHYQRALALIPNPVEAHYNSKTQVHYNLGLIYRARKQWAEAEAQFRACVRDNPESARAHSNLGVALVALRRDEEGMEQFRAAARLDPNRAGEANILATLDAACAEAGKFDEAIAAAEKARAAAIAEGRQELATAAGERIQKYRKAKQ